MKKSMFLNLPHIQMDVYNVARKFVIQCYKITKNFPADERFNLTQQIKRAALSVQLNIAEGCSRKSLVERNRFYEIARGSLVEVDSAFEAAGGLNYLENLELDEVGNLLTRLYSMLTKMIK